MPIFKKYTTLNSKKYLKSSNKYISKIFIIIILLYTKIIFLFLYFLFLNTKN